MTTTSSGSIEVDGERRVGVRSDRRLEILDAAIKLFRERGFHGASIDEIGAAAGVTGPAIYYYFSDKASLLAAVFSTLGDRIFSGMDGIVDTTIGIPKERLAKLVFHHARLVYELRGVFPVIFQEDRNLPPLAAKRALQRRSDFVDYWAQPLMDLRPELRRQEAWSLAASAVWLIHSLAYYNHPLNRGQAISLVTRAALAAMLGPDPSHGAVDALVTDF